MKFISFLLLTVFAVSTVIGQTNREFYRVFDATGAASDIDSVVERAGSIDVIFLGELHDDAVGHSLQMDIFRRIVEEYSAKRPVVLSLEMFERDVQVVLDEYLAGLITERHFLASSRPWGNYETDYRPLVELAKEKKLKVVAANAPRRYVNMVSRNGRTSVESLSPEAKKWIAPLPFGVASDAYAKKFNAMMGKMHDPSQPHSNILESQTLWDATMAYSVADALRSQKNTLVVHLNGGFHTEQRLGTVEHLMKYREGTKAVVVTMRYEDEFQKFDAEKHSALGDFVVLTDAKQPRSGK